MISDSPETGFLRQLEQYCRNLCEADWNDPMGPLRLNRELSCEDLRDAEFFQNTRQFLLALQEQDGTAATATGNLNRAFVKHMFDRVTLSPQNRRDILRYNKVLNEHDLWVLHLSRIMSGLAGLTVRRSKRFKLTKRGTALLPEDRAGELYHTLFVAYFREFDLQYNFNWRDVPGIQQSMAVNLWRIDEVLENWQPAQGLPPKILLPRVHQQLRKAMVSEYDKEEWIFSGYVLEPLLSFGLIERQARSEWPRISEEDSVRLTPLWNKFISFVPFAGMN
jgi:hypothetical protein